MKTIITSNWRPLCRALCTVLIVSGALWAMPRSARAQLYVSQLNLGSVGEYNLATEAFTPSFITGLNWPVILALSGNNLFVSNQFGGTVGEYDATNGDVINPSLITGLSGPTGLALSGNTLFVSNSGITNIGVTTLGTTVSEYNLATEAFTPNFITGLNGPAGLALSGSDLFVANLGNGTVAEYNAANGDVINPSLITGLNYPGGLALSGNTLFVANQLGNTISEYNLATEAFTPNFIAGLNYPVELALSGNTLFVTNANGGTVGEYDAANGDAINPSLITGLNGPAGLVVASVPEPSTWSMVAVGGVALLGIMLRKKRHTA